MCAARRFALHEMNGWRGGLCRKKRSQDRLWKICSPVLLVLAVLAMAKTLFVGLEINEVIRTPSALPPGEGDYTMWEPHGFGLTGNAGAGAVYRAGTTTGALLFVRAVVLVCKAAISAVSAISSRPLAAMGRC